MDESLSSKLLDMRQETSIAPESVLFWTRTATSKYLCNKWTV